MTAQHLAGLPVCLLIVLAALPVSGQKHPVYDPGEPSSTYVSNADSCFQYSAMVLAQMRRVALLPMRGVCAILVGKIHARCKRR
jgi:hypothetical protein